MTEPVTSSPLTDHFDLYLGEIKSGWRTKDDDGNPGSFSLAQFTLNPAPEWMVLGTYGLSKDVLEQGDEDGLRQELLIAWPESEFSDNLLSHFNAVGQTVHQTGKVLGRGALLAIPQEPALPSHAPQPFVAWYVTMPFFLPEEGIMLADIEPPMVFTWLFPVYEDEADFIAMEGPDAFDQLILANRQTCFLRPRPSLLASV